MLSLKMKHKADQFHHKGERQNKTVPGYLSLIIAADTLHPGGSANLKDSLVPFLTLQRPVGPLQVLRDGRDADQPPRHGPVSLRPRF